MQKCRKILTASILAWLLLSNVGLLTMHSQALEHLMDKNEVEGAGNGQKIYLNNMVAQCFNASESYTLTKVSLYVEDQVPNDNPLTVEIYDNDDSGTPLDFSDDIPGTSISPQVNSNGPDDVFAWLNFSFGAGIPLTKDTRYWIVANSSDTINKGYRWKSSGTDTYPEGYMVKTAAPTWQIVQPPDDLMFRVYTEGYRPQLENPAVFPPGGDGGEFFNFTVTYLDLDDDAPVNMNVTIIGPVSMNVSMQALDPDDSIYTDGKDYYHNISLPDGIYTYYFVTNDTLFWNRTQDFILTVGNVVCELNNPTVSPATGMGGQYFNFTVNYLDANDDAPTPINVIISGPSSLNITMLPIDLSDNDYTDGKDYYYNISLPPGTYNYYFIANDSRDWNATGTYVLIVYNNVPQLSLPQVVPSTGFTDSEFNFTVTYTDLDNHPPDTITVNITGMGEYDLNEVDPLDLDYTDGKEYYYDASGFSIGIHDFHFAANDTFGNWTESITLQFEVVNSAPGLSLAQVDPITGYNDTRFNFTVTYRDLDNHAPGTITVNITNFGVIDLMEADPSDVDFTDGKLYYLNISGLANGTSYSFHFAANDTFGNWTETAEILGPQVMNTPPTLASPVVNPSFGTSITYFNFTVTYMDIDNNSPDNITLNLTGPSGGTFALLEADPSDTDYSDGKVYYYNTTLSNGTYSFHCAANDSVGFCVETTEINAPIVGISNPIFAGPDVAPVSGFTDTWFNFTVSYTHPFDKAPDTITLNLSGPSGGIFGLVEVDPSDTDYTDGKQYYCNTSGLAVGPYSYHFAANDTDGKWSETGEMFLPLVINRVPALSLSQVTPSVGYIDTWFNFTVVYTDLDNHAPGTITVNITGFGIYGLVEDDPSDVDYTDGKTYHVNLTGVPIGTSHTFHFAANDIIGEWVEGPEMDGPDVLNREPILSSGQVDPTTGFMDTGFNFTVTYTDFDSHAPDTLTVNVTGLGVYDLIEADSTDTDYTDGKVYCVNISNIPLGTAYTFHFAANDTLGRWAMETPEIDAPDVLERTATLTALDVTAKHSDAAYLNATLMGGSYPIAGEDIAFYIDINDNGNYEAGELAGIGQTLVDGTVSVSYPVTLVPAVYSLLATYLGTLYSVPNDNALLTVTPKPAAIILPSRITEEGQGVTLNATLLDEDNTGVAGQKIEFYVDRNRDGIPTGSELVGTGETDSNGHIGVSDTIITPQLITGSYHIWAKYKGSGNYTVIEGSAILSVHNTTNNPPQIAATVPDQIKPEDTPSWELDLTPYETDIEDSGVNLRWYITGINTSLYTVMGENSTNDVLTFIPVEDAFGNDEVILWLWDSNGGTRFQALWVNITPVNDRPRIGSINPLTVHFDDEYTYFFYNYISDIEDSKEDLVLSTDDPAHTTVDGLSINFLYPESLLGTTVNVLITVTDTEGGSTSTIVIVRITDDWVPELETEMPDVTLYEGEIITGVFDLDDYFSDPDGDALFYATGQSYVTIDINPYTHVVNITAPTDWFGSETISFHALDPSNARVEDIILITVLPINDVPSISNVPDLVVRFDQDYKFDLSPYICDEDNDDAELMLSFVDPDTGLTIPGINVDPNNNLGMIINLPESMNGTIIRLQIQVSDGLDYNSSNIMITVSDDYPPELITPIPDVSFKEDTTLSDAFNIYNFFIDIDDNYLIYTSGHDYINVTVNQNGNVDFTAPANWSGSERVTFRATDDTGALVECTITVTVIPVNDAPTIGAIPAQEGEQGIIWVLDIHQYLFDIDNDIEDLSITVDSEYVNVVGHTLIFDYPDGVENDLVTITVNDGALESSVTVPVTISQAESHSTEPLLMDYILWLILIPIILAALFLIFTTYKRMANAPFVDEIFLIANDGTLIAYNSLSLEEEIDKDILSGMLTGVKNLISDAFIRDKGREKGLHKLEFGDRNILLEKGNHFYIALVFSGEENKRLLKKTQSVINEIEEKYGEVLANWTGEMHAFVDTDEIIEPLLSLEKLSKDELEHLRKMRRSLKEAQELAIRELDMQLVNLLAQEKEELDVENLQRESEGAHSEYIEIHECPLCESKIGSTDIRCPVCGVEFSDAKDGESSPTEDDNEDEVHEDEGEGVE